jgi:hypothetical protein
VRDSICALRINEICPTCSHSHLKAWVVIIFQLLRASRVVGMGDLHLQGRGCAKFRAYDVHNPVQRLTERPGLPLLGVILQFFVPPDQRFDLKYQSDQPLDIANATAISEVFLFLQRAQVVGGIRGLFQ